MTVSAMLAEIPELGTLSRQRNQCAYRCCSCQPGLRDYAWPANHFWRQGWRKNQHCNMAALVATRFNPVIKTFYVRLLAAGKAKKSGAGSLYA
ncbi:transposase-like protein [Klebsiella pneumoniae]|nr:transposase-like protein [Klebsiella pneumoniae]